MVGCVGRVFLPIIRCLFLMLVLSGHVGSLSAENFCLTCGRPCGTDLEHPECHRAKCLLYQQILTETKRGKLSQTDRDHLQKAYIAAMFLRGFVVSAENTMDFSIKFSETSHPQIKRWKNLLFRYLKSDGNALFFARLLVEAFDTNFTIVAEATRKDRSISLLLLYTLINNNANNPDALKFILAVLYLPATAFFGIHFEETGTFLGGINMDSLSKNFRATIQTCAFYIRNAEELIFFLHQIEHYLKIKINFQVGTLPLPEPLPQEPPEESASHFLRYNFPKAS